MVDQGVAYASSPLEELTEMTDLQFSVDRQTFSIHFQRTSILDGIGVRDSILTAKAHRSLAAVVHAAPKLAARERCAATRAAAFVPVPARGVRKCSAHQRPSNVGQPPALKARSAATKAAVSALRLVESARSNIANQLNAVGKYALQARCAVIPVVEYALLQVRLALSNFAYTVMTTLENRTKIIHSCSGILTLMVMSLIFWLREVFGCGKRLQLFLL
ncbi:hypothetical protein ACJ73_00757 [Blastomyces percursus]|uniref:Uncharacterized protein n=1 Tax=Blastomyces percursus TaxID=1658174 RepID=A0A1J9RJR1_9EURO|nr:hypothetical protein ACJ73_00757 [Blastomyces percursus]